METAKKSNNNPDYLSWRWRELKNISKTGLGPYDIVFIKRVKERKRSRGKVLGSKLKGLLNGKDGMCYMYVLGQELSSIASIGSYLAKIINEEGIKTGYILYISYNFISQKDVCIEINIPGKLMSYMVGRDFKKDNTTEINWEELELSGYLRYLKYCKNLRNCIWAPFTFHGKIQVLDIFNRERRLKFLNLVYKYWSLANLDDLEEYNHNENILKDGLIEFFRYLKEKDVLSFMKKCPLIDSEKELKSMIYLERENFKEVDEIIKNEIEPKIWINYQKCLLALKNGNKKDAYKFAIYCIKNNPSSHYNWILVAKSLVIIKKYKEAVRFLTSIPWKQKNLGFEEVLSMWRIAKEIYKIFLEINTKLQEKDPNFDIKKYLKDIIYSEPLSPNEPFYLITRKIFKLFSRDIDLLKNSGKLTYSNESSNIDGNKKYNLLIAYAAHRQNNFNIAIFHYERALKYDNPSFSALIGSLILCSEYMKLDHVNLIMVNVLYQSMKGNYSFPREFFIEIYKNFILNYSQEHIKKSFINSVEKYERESNGLFLDCNFESVLEKGLNLFIEENN